MGTPPQRPLKSIEKMKVEKTVSFGAPRNGPIALSVMWLWRPYNETRSCTECFHSAAEKKITSESKFVQNDGGKDEISLCISSWGKVLV